MKKLISALLCAMVAAVSLVVPVSALDTSDDEFCTGSMVKCGKFIVSAVNNVKQNKLKIYRTNLKGKKKKLAATTKNYTGKALLTYKDKVYYRKNNVVMSYDPKADKKKKLFNLNAGEHKAKNTDNISVLSICPLGIIYRDAACAIYLYGFDGSDTMVADSSTSKVNCYNTFLGATEDRIFYYRAEKKSGSSYVLQLYGFIYSDGKVQKVGKIRSLKNPYTVPNDGTFYMLKKKIVFTVGAPDKNGMFEGVLCSMKKDGTGIKTLKTGSIGSAIFPSDSGAYITSTDSKGNTILCKISENGKLKQAIAYTDIKYPIISYTTESGRAVGINVADTEFGYDLYTLDKVKKTTGKKVIEAKSLLEKSDYGYILVTPSISGSVGDLVLVTYGVYRYDNNGYFEKVYRCKSYIVNAKTGTKILIDT